MAFDLQRFLSEKRGPLPTWVYISGVALVAGFFLLKPKGKAGKGGDQGQLATGTGTYSTSNTDAAGNSTSASYTGPAYSPGFLSTGSPYPMPYGPGDVYVNLPGNSSQGQGSLPVAYPPVNPPAAGPGRVGSFWYTPTADMDSVQLEKVGYQLPDTNDPNVLEGRAVDVMKMVLLNPQVDWTQPVKAGTPIFMPLVGGVPGKTIALPSGGSQQAPSSYQPPAQQTSVSLIPSAAPMPTPASAVPATSATGSPVK